MNIVILLIVLLLVFGGLPYWGYHSYGYAPSGLGFFLLIVVLVLIASGRF